MKLLPQGIQDQEPMHSAQIQITKLFSLGRTEKKFELVFRLMKEMKKKVDRFCGKYQMRHISHILPHLPLSCCVGEENFHPALVILSLSGQIGSAQRAALLLAVMFETDKSGQTSMAKSQSSECLRSEAYIIAGQQHWNGLAGFLLLTQKRGCFFIEVGTVGHLISLRGERSLR